MALLVKDEIDTASMATTLGTVILKDYRPTRDAFVVDKLRKGGRHHPRQDHAVGVRALRYVRLDVRGDAQSLRCGAHGGRLVRRFWRGGGGQFLHRCARRGRSP
jgi:hypothetical protein